MSNLCKTCKDINCLNYSTKVEECLDYERMTNADRIRAKTVEDLAKWMNRNNFCPDPLPEAPCIGPDGEPRAEFDCYQCCLDWLRQEVIL